MYRAFQNVLLFNHTARRKTGDFKNPEVPQATNSGAAVIMNVVDKMERVHAGIRTALEDARANPIDAKHYLRIRLILEESIETFRAMVRGDTAEVADGLADLCYVAIDAAVAYGIDLGPVWAAVQAANMAKFPQCGTCGGRGKIGTVMTPTSAIPEKLCDVCGATGRTAVFDEAGKICKPEGWAPPDIEAVLAQQRV